MRGKKKKKKKNVQELASVEACLVVPRDSEDI